MPHFSIQKLGRSFVRFIRTYADTILIVSVLAVGGLAIYLFYQMLYPALFAPQTPPAGETVFSRPIYDRVMNRIQTRTEHLNEKLQNIPPNPFN